MAFESRGLIPNMGIWGSFPAPLTRKDQNRQFLRKEIKAGEAGRLLAKKLLSILDHFNTTPSEQPYTRAQTEILSDPKTIIRLWKNLKSGSGFFEKIKTWFIALKASKRDLNSAGKLATKIAALLMESDFALSKAEIDSVVKTAVREACNLYDSLEVATVYEVVRQAAYKARSRAELYWRTTAACGRFLVSLAKSPSSSTNTSPLSSPSSSRSEAFSSSIA